MKATRDRTDKLFRQLQALPGKILRDPDAKLVHDLRTSARRVEALLGLNDEHRKLARRLRKLRKAAGKVRDLDVQIKAAEELDLAVGKREQARLLLTLRKQRRERYERLRKQVKEHADKGFLRRLNDARSTWKPQAEVLAKSAADALPRELAALRVTASGVTESNLHAFRLASKRARYLAEASHERAAQTIVTELKRVQDAIGAWHDTLVLTESAEEIVTGAGRATFLAALRAHRRSLLTQALRTVAELNARLASRTLGTPPRKAVRRQADEEHAATA